MSFDTPSSTPDAETPTRARRDPSEDVIDDPRAQEADLDDALDDDEFDDGFEREDDDASDDSDDDDEESVLYEDQVQPEYGILGFTLRELIIVGTWLVAFLASFFPVVPGLPTTIWGSGIGWILTIGVPTAAVFLVVLRRFSPQGIRRVGSLGIDQFASVAASVAAVAWAQLLWNQVTATVQTASFLVGWPVIVAQLATLALVAATTAAPLIPRLREDFEGRVERLAHRSANPVRPVISRPRPVAAAPVAAPVAEPVIDYIGPDAPVDAGASNPSGAPAETPDAEQPADDLDATRTFPWRDAAALSPVPPAAPVPPAPPAAVAGGDVSQSSDGLPVGDSTATGGAAPAAAELPAAEEPSAEEPAAELPAAPEQPVVAEEPSSLEQPSSPEEPSASEEPIDAVPLPAETTADADAPTTVIDDRTSVLPRYGEMLPKSAQSQPAAVPGQQGELQATASDSDESSFADSAPIEVYNTGAVEVLQQIFEADGATTPIAVDSSDTGTIGSERDDKPVLRRDRAEQVRSEPSWPAPDPAPQPFWILARTERDVLDELGRPLFRIGPSDWTLVIEDRGGAFVVRHEDGRIGYLHDMSDITKG